MFVRMSGRSNLSLIHQGIDDFRHDPTRQTAGAQFLRIWGKVAPSSATLHQIGPQWINPLAKFDRTRRDSAEIEPTWVQCRTELDPNRV